MLNHNQRPCQPIKKKEIKFSVTWTPQTLTSQTDKIKKETYDEEIGKRKNDVCRVCFVY